jgi:hypothetical protein
MTESASWQFVGPTVGVIVSSTSEQFFVQSNATIYAPSGVRLGISYEPGGSQISGGGTPVSPPSFLSTIAPPSGTIPSALDDGVSQVFFGLSPGFYQFGMVYLVSASDGAQSYAEVTSVLDYYEPPPII